MNICPYCHGYGTWEFWGRVEQCHMCSGSGELDAPDECYCRYCGFTFEPEESVHAVEVHCPQCGQQINPQ